MFEKLRRHSHYFTHHCHSFGIVESILKTVIRDCPVGGIAEVHSYFKQVSYLAFLLAYAMAGKQSQSVTSIVRSFMIYSPYKMYGELPSSRCSASTG